MILGSDVLLDPQKGAPQQSSHKQRCSLSGALQLSLKFHQRTPQQAPRDTPISRAFFYTFPSKSPVNEPPPCSPTPSLWREKVYLQKQWFIHSFISIRVPNKEPSHEKSRICLVTVHGAARGQKAYIQWGAAWFPKGIVYDTAISTPVPCSLQHDTFHLGLGSPEPH
jgi:hypothetical protein